MNNDIKGLKKAIKKNKELLTTVDPYGRTPLMDAAIHDRLKIAEILIKAGVDVNAREVKGRGWSALNFACQTASLEIVRLLLDNGAETNGVDTFGNTVLGTAVMNSKGEGEIITLLLEAGADPHIKNSYGISPYSAVQQIDNYNIRQWFE